MNVPAWVWACTLTGLTAIVIADLVLAWRSQDTVPSTRQATFRTLSYVTLAVVFGLGLLFFAGAEQSAQFYAGYLTEYSLSIDNLFVFYLIIAKFGVPRASQQRVLTLGILVAVILRGIFIVIGTAAVTHFEWLFFVFGIFLVYTGWGVAREGLASEEEFTDGRAMRLLKRVLPATTEYHGSRLITPKGSGPRMLTPLFLVLLSIEIADVMFAVDSVPAILGLTTDRYIVFTASIFAIMGLRQLYFLLDHLVRRLVYLHIGLALILVFIGIKLTLHALHATWLPQTPVVPTWSSLVFIGAVLTVTVIASMRKTHGLAHVPRQGGPKDLENAIPAERTDH